MDVRIVLALCSNVFVQVEGGAGHFYEFTIIAQLSLFSEYGYGKKLYAAQIMFPQLNLQ